MNNGVYKGDDIIIEEMPQGCVVVCKSDPYIYITVSSLQDAMELIESLERMLKIQHGVTRT